MRQSQLTPLLLTLCCVTGIVSAADDWWEYGHFYQIYPRSFQDSDGDGLGDINGITQRLPYLKSINVTGVWLSPIFQSPMRDMGYDISDFRKIHREFGTMADFDRMVARCKELDIKLILDFVPNHSSDQHEWFKKSADPQDPQHHKYRNFYIWHEGKLLENGTRVPPSNWVSVFRGSAWTWVSSRKAFYLHQFLKEQPDLNFRNPAVLKEMNQVLRFWLRKGVSGFRIDAVPHLFEVAENMNNMYDDEPLSGTCSDPEDYCYHTHTKTTHMNETYDLIYQWRSVMDEREFRKQTRILMTEAYGSVPVMARYYGKVENEAVVRYGAQIPFNFQLMSVTRTSLAPEFFEDINAWLQAMPMGDKIQANWVLGNHDGSRVASRYGPERTDLFNILIKTLPGITVTYNGEEIGMTDVDVSAIDKEARSRARTPFQWDNTTNSGFSTNPKTWLPVADNYTINNVELQESTEMSHLRMFQRLMLLRQNPTMKYGSLTSVSAENGKLLVYKREISSNNDPTQDVFVVVLNLSDGDISGINLNSENILNCLPKEMKVVVSSIHSKQFNQIVDSTKFNIGANDGVVLVGRRKDNTNCDNTLISSDIVSHPVLDRID